MYSTMAERKKAESRHSKWLRQGEMAKQRASVVGDRGAAEQAAKSLGLAAYQCTRVHSIWDESIL